MIDSERWAAKTACRGQSAHERGTGTRPRLALKFRWTWPLVVQDLDEHRPHVDWGSVLRIPRRWQAMNSHPDPAIRCAKHPTQGIGEGLRQLTLGAPQYRPDDQDIDDRHGVAGGAVATVGLRGPTLEQSVRPRRLAVHGPLSNKPSGVAPHLACP